MAKSGRIFLAALEGFGQFQALGKGFYWMLRGLDVAHYGGHAVMSVTKDGKVWKLGGRVVEPDVWLCLTSCQQWVEVEVTATGETFKVPPQVGEPEFCHLIRRAIENIP